MQPLCFWGLRTNSAKIPLNVPRDRRLARSSRTHHFGWQTTLSAESSARRGCALDPVDQPGLPVDGKHQAHPQRNQEHAGTAEPVGASNDHPVYELSIALPSNWRPLPRRVQHAKDAQQIAGRVIDQNVMLMCHQFAGALDTARSAKAGIINQA